jgi:hypothetical protein
MKTRKSTSLFILASFLILGFSLPDVIPEHWFKAGNMPDKYKFGVDSIVFKNGQKSAFIESTIDNIEGFATLMQRCIARDYLGTRIKMTAYIKSENLSDWSGMWLRVDSSTPGESLSFDNMQDRPVTGSSDWTKCEIILDVPENSGTINYGVLIIGSGKIWFDNVSFEILDNMTPEKSDDLNMPQIPEKPKNLDFEE